jgi:transposase-like protein
MHRGYRYSCEVKARSVKRLLARAISIEELAEETGISSSTLGRWRQKALNGGDVKRKLPPDNRPPEEKLRLLIESSTLSNEELGEFLRRNGVHEAQLNRWRDTMLGALGGSNAPKDKSQERRRIKNLERELCRKDKALAEVTALLALKKKVEMLWGDEEDDTVTQNDTM